MESITVAIENMFNEKQIPVRKTELPDNQYSYVGRFKLGQDEHGKDNIIDFGVTIREFEENAAQAENPTTDYLIHYRQVKYLTNFEDRGTALEIFNDIHLQRLAGYYTLCLNGDGEIFINTFGRTNRDMTAFYDTLVLGSQIAKNINNTWDELLEKKKAEAN